MITIGIIGTIALAGLKAAEPILVPIPVKESK